MSRVWFSTGLETVATYWQVHRTDGVALGFTSHDAALWFDGVEHLALPGMVPSSIRKTATLDADSVEVTGVLSHAAISSTDLMAGRYDNAAVRVGLVDWNTLEHQLVYSGSIGTVSGDDNTFSAELRSLKADLQQDFIPRTSPSCRADFCGPGCGLSAPLYTHEGLVEACDVTSQAVTLSGPFTASALVGGSLRWLDGAYAGQVIGVVGLLGGAVVLDSPIDAGVTAGTRVLLREGCDRTLQTCSSRFNNAVNFQGEPFLPGNDLVARYGTGQ